MSTTTTPSESNSSLAKLAKGILGITVTFTMLFGGLAVVSMMFVSDDVPDSKQAPSIVASIGAFQAGLPILGRGEGIKRSVTSEGIQYNWKPSDQPNWAIFWDNGGDESIDFISLCLVFPKDDKMKGIEQIVMMLRFVEVASGEKLDSGEFSAWLSGNLATSAKTPVERVFGLTPVSFRTTPVDGGGLVWVSIGEKD